MEVAQLPGCCVSWRQLDKCNRLWRNDRRTPRHWPLPWLVQRVMEPSTSSLPPPSTTRADTVKAFAENLRASYRRHYPHGLPLLGWSIDSGSMTAMLLLFLFPADEPTLCPAPSQSTSPARAYHQHPLEALLAISHIGARLLYHVRRACVATSITHILKRNFFC
jgi:hypothetical protein